MARLVWSVSTGAREYELANDVVLGRSNTADVVIEDETVSRRHARVLRSDEGWDLEDLGSGNGTILNAMVLQGRTPLADGDELTLGRIRITFRATEGDAPSVVFNDESGERLRSLDVGVAPSEGGRSTATTSEYLRMIADVASAIAQAPNESELFHLVADKLFAIFPQCERVCIVLIDQATGDFRPRLARSRSGSAEQIPVSRAILDEVIRDRRTVLTADAAADTRFAGSGTVMQFNLRTLLCAPMIAADRVLGAIQIDGSDPGRPFEENDLATLLAIAAQTALATSNSRITEALSAHTALTQDLALATRIQTHFVPQQPPSVPRYAFDWTYTPALAIGGDVCDFIRLSDTHTALLVGDVSGKGISAALYMAKLGSIIRAQCVGKTDPGDILRRVNKTILPDMTAGMFVTLLLMVLNSAKDELQVASAGHMSPILRKPSGEIVTLTVPQNEPLGMPNYGGLEQEKFKLEVGDVVTAYSDGISEAMDGKAALFGDARLHYAISSASPASPQSVKKSVLMAVEKFCAGAAQSDDITLLTFGIVG